MPRPRNHRSPRHFREISRRTIVKGKRTLGWAEPTRPQIVVFEEIRDIIIARKHGKAERVERWRRRNTVKPNLAPAETDSLKRRKMCGTEHSCLLPRSFAQAQPPCTYCRRFRGLVAAVAVVGGGASRGRDIPQTPCRPLSEGAAPGPTNLAGCETGREDPPRTLSSFLGQIRAEPFHHVFGVWQ